MEDHDSRSPGSARQWPERFRVAFSFAGAQRDLVRTIATAVEQKIGATGVFFDEWFRHAIAGNDGDRTLQEIYERCDVAVVCVSSHYDAKDWTQAEYEVIRVRVMKSRKPGNSIERFGVLPIRVGDGDVRGFPMNAIVPDVREISIDEAAQLIVDRLRLIDPALADLARVSPAHLAWPAIPTSLAWTMADHTSVRDAFISLMSPESSSRVLLIRGESGTGKSHITREIMANALGTPELSCGCFNFKGTAGMDIELRAFVQHLRVPLPPADRPLNERFADVLDELTQRVQPALLVFDTYEAAGEAENWVEKQLLPALIRAKWLRVVIAGQKVPDRAGSIWARVASPPHELAIPSAKDWFEFGRLPDHWSLSDVEKVYERIGKSAGLLAQFFGPAN